MQKRLFISNKLRNILFTAALTVSSLLFSMNAFAATQEEAVDYAKSKLDTIVGSGQCVDFVKDYYLSVFGEEADGDGRDYINNVPDGWTQILYDCADFEVKPGDVVCWSWNKYSPIYGHVGIILQETEDGFTYLDQNPGAVHQSEFVYDQEGWILAGVVRPAFSNENAVQETK